MTLHKIHEKELTKHKAHRNVLYGFVIVLALLQLVSFVVLSAQVSRMSVKLDQEVASLSHNIDLSNVDLKDFTQELMRNYDELYQENFREIALAISLQEEEFQQEIKLLQSGQEDFSGIAKDAVKSVVTISTDRSIGTGFIINEEGYVITNYHVIAGREERINVLTHERKILPATLIGRDETRDLALLSIPDRGEYIPLILADSDNLQVGKKVIAIGNPLGLSFTVTEGIISALHRRGPSGLSEYVQTDVSLNPGNSGGPLIDTTGKVVGINNFKIGGAESLGFSLESNAIRDTTNKLANRTIIS